jgi:hypothetical protein
LKTATRLLPLVLLLTLPVMVQAQFTFTTNSGTITITSYIGTNSVVVIPDTINRLPVTSIGQYAFFLGTNITSVTISTNITSIGERAFDNCTSLTSLEIPNSVTYIGESLCSWCSSLTNVTLGSGVTSIGEPAFNNCTNLRGINVETNNPVYSSVSGVLFDENQTTLIEYPGGKFGSYSIPNSVTSIGAFAFISCTSLASITIPNSVTYIGDAAFQDCTSLTSVYFQGNAPNVSYPATTEFYSDNNATAHYLPGTTGWGSTFCGIPTALWRPLILTSTPSFGVPSNQFGFTVSWATNLSVIIQASSDLANWSPVTTNVLSGGTFYFSDPQWTNYPRRFYRVRSQ